MLETTTNGDGAAAGAGCGRAAPAGVPDPRPSRGRRRSRVGFQSLDLRGRDLRQREVQHRLVVIGGVGAGVPGAQQTAQRLARSAGPVREFETDTEVLIGYARGSTGDQNLALRLDAVKPARAAGRVFRDADSRGRGGSAPELDACLEPERSSQAAVSSRSARTQFGVLVRNVSPAANEGRSDARSRAPDAPSGGGPVPD